MKVNGEAKSSQNLASPSHLLHPDLCRSRFFEETRRYTPKGLPDQGPILEGLGGQGERVPLSRVGEVLVCPPRGMEEAEQYVK